jgi:Flp pilus assembly pilin Flp
VQVIRPMVCEMWRTFVRDEQGQDLVEYSLLLAFVCLAGAAMFIGMGQTTAGLWTVVNTRLAAANQSS